jgi:hypothetical protein
VWLAQVLQSYNMPTSTTLFVSAHWDGALGPKGIAVVEALKQAGYTVRRSGSTSV